MTVKKQSLDKSLIKIVLFEGISQQAVDYFKKSGYTNIHYYTKAFDGEELIEKIHDAHIIGIRSRTFINEKILNKCSKLIVVGCFCIGTNQVDLEACANRGVVVFNAPFSNTRSVAELVICQVIMLMRNLLQSSLECHRGIWNKSAAGSHEVRGKTLGILGYGAIGRQVSVLAEAMGLKVIFFDQSSQLSLGNASPVFTIEELFRQSDLVTLHIPEAASNEGLINKNIINHFKDGSYLINASRGAVLNIDDVVDAIKSGKLAGVALDVFPKEPKDISEPFINPLIGFDNAILTPHIGGSTIEAQDNIGTEVAQKLVAYSDVGTTQQAVNFPDVNLPQHLDTNVSRILHIHKLRSNIINEINSVFAENGTEVRGQYLQTKNNIGYVVIDFVNNPEFSNKDLKAQLKSIESTINCRILY